MGKKQAINASSMLRQVMVECTLPWVEDQFKIDECRAVMQIAFDTFAAVGHPVLMGVSCHYKDRKTDENGNMIPVPVHLHFYAWWSNSVRADTLMKRFAALKWCQSEDQFNILQVMDSKRHLGFAYLVHALPTDCDYFPTDWDELEQMILDQGKFPYWSHDNRDDCRAVLNIPWDLHDVFHPAFKETDGVTDPKQKTFFGFVDRLVHPPMSAVNQQASSALKIAEDDNRIIQMYADGKARPYDLMSICKAVFPLSYGSAYARLKTKAETAFNGYLNSLPEDREMHVMFLYGSAGSGKTSFAYHHCKTKYPSLRVYTADAGDHPMDGYDGQEIVILDEFDPKEWTLKRVLSLLDPYHAKSAPARYHAKDTRQVQLIIITTVFDPEQCYQMFGKADHEDPRQWSRRLNDILCFGGSCLEPVDGSLNVRFAAFIGFDKWKKQVGSLYSAQVPVYQTRPQHEFENKEEFFIDLNNI